MPTDNSGQGVGRNTTSRESTTPGKSEGEKAANTPKSGGSNPSNPGSGSSGVREKG